MDTTSSPRESHEDSWPLHDSPDTPSHQSSLISTSRSDLTPPARVSRDDSGSVRRIESHSEGALSHEVLDDLSTSRSLDLEVSPTPTKKTDSSRSSSAQLNLSENLANLAIGDSKSPEPRPTSNAFAHIDNLDDLFTPSPTSSVKNGGAAPRLPTPTTATLQFSGSDNQTRGVRSSSVSSSVSSDKRRARPGLLDFGESASRRSDERLRALEIENFDLKLKLQKTRELNAGNEELQRVLTQLKRAERRIVELEGALSRKNDEIKRLSAQREQWHASQRESSEELRTRLNDLESRLATETETRQAAESRTKSLEGQLRNSAQSETEAHAHSLKLAYPILDRLALDVPSYFEGVEKLDTRRDDWLTAALDRFAEGTRNLFKDFERAVALVDAHKEVDDDLASLLRNSGAAAAVQATSESDTLQIVARLLTRSRELEDALADRDTKLATQTRHQHELADQLHDTGRVNSQLEATLQRAQADIAELEAQLDARPQDISSLHHSIRESEEQVEQQRAAAALASSQLYGLIKRFFVLLNERLGPDFKRDSDEALAQIIAEAREKGVSKVPLLSALLLRYTGNLAEDARRAQLLPELQVQLVTLHQTLKNKLDEAGANRVQAALIRDLEHRLKLESEKRRTEYEHFTRTIERLTQVSDIES